MALDGPDVLATGAGEDGVFGALLNLHDRFPMALLAEDEALRFTGRRWWGGDTGHAPVLVRSASLST